jgi:uncharacterized protein
MKRFQWVLSIILAVLMSGHALAQDANMPAEKRAAIEKLLEKTKALDVGKQMANGMVAQMTQGLRQARPDIPKNALDFLPEVVSEVLTDDKRFFADLFISMYHQHFSLEDIQNMLAFYESPTGQKVIEKQTLMLQQGMVIGGEWGRRLQPEINRRVRERLVAQGIKL